MQTKSFAFRDLLTVTTGRLLTAPREDRDNGIGDLYELLGWMCGESPFSHQLPRFAKECKPWLLRWYPELARADDLLPILDDSLKGAEAAGLSRAEWAEIIAGWLDGVRVDCGLREIYDVPKIPMADHDRIDPLAELVEKVGVDRVIVTEG